MINMLLPGGRASRRLLKRAIILMIILGLGYTVLQLYASSQTRARNVLSVSSLQAELDAEKSLGVPGEEKADKISESLDNNEAKQVSTESFPERVEGETKLVLSDTKLELSEKPLAALSREARVNNKKNSPKDGPKLKNIIASSTPTKVQQTSSPCSNIHIFYYPWYNSLKFDGAFTHWNHPTLSHWDKSIDKLYEKKSHKPPNDVASSFYPELGAYSSRDPAVIANHFEQISDAGAGVIVVSYYPSGQGDDNGKSWDDIHMLLLNKAVKHNMKVTFQIEPYKDRNEDTVRKDVMMIIDTFGSHEGFYKHRIKEGVFVPLIYVYDSYQTKPEDWARVLKPEGQTTIRGTKYDAVMIALLVEFDHARYVTMGGFDGLYTYFATNGFTYGSTWLNWKELARISKQMNSLFIPSVGPGYDDVSIRPWNGENTRARANGAYYKDSWKCALESVPEIVTITSFNEWHEGTQIERAVPKRTNTRTYKDYAPFSPDRYLTLTRKFADQFSMCQKDANRLK